MLDGFRIPFRWKAKCLRLMQQGVNVRSRARSITLIRSTIRLQCGFCDFLDERVVRLSFFDRVTVLMITVDGL